MDFWNNFHFCIFKKNLNSQFVEILTGYLFISEAYKQT